MNKQEIRLPKTKVGQKSFKKIIKAGKTLFGKAGYNSTSINDIISKAKVAAGTFYIYFDDKFALYNFLLNQYRQSIRKAINEGIKDATTRYEKERLGLKAFLKFAWQDPLSYRIIWESMFVDKDLFKQYYQKFSAAYVKNLEISVTEGQLDPEVSLETLSYVLMGISNFVGLQVLFRDTLTDKDLDKIVDEVMYMLKNGIFNKK